MSTRSVTIRDMPDEVVDELASRAARGGRSLQEFLRDELVQLASAPDLAQWSRQVREMRASTTSRVTRQSILAAKDADRR